MTSQTAVEREKAALGHVVRSLRLARELSIKDVASAAGVSCQFLAGIEHGEHNPTASQLYAIAEALDSRLGDLLKEAAPRGP